MAPNRFGVIFLYLGKFMGVIQNGMAMDPIIKFGTSGWRGLIARDFTFENLNLAAEAFGRVLGKELKKKRSPIHGRRPLVIVGFDARFMGPEFAKNTAHILQDQGFEVQVVDRDTPTPVLAYGIIKRNAIAGVNITASHNPPQYSGFKVSLWNGAGAPKEWTNAIEDQAAALRKRNWTWKGPKVEKAIKSIDLSGIYCKRIAQLVDLEMIAASKIRIGIDAMHGAGRNYLSRLLSDAGADFHAIREDLNPSFEGRNPEPDPEGMSQIREWLLSNKGHVALGLDGDADRFGILDRDGTWLTPNQILTLVLYHLTKNKGLKGSVVRTVPTSHQVEELAHTLGIQVHETPVGFKHIAAIMESEKVIVGGEESGGLSIQKHIPEKDGILACLLIAELIACEKKSLAAILGKITRKIGPFITSRINIPVDPNAKDSLIKMLSGTIDKIGSAKVEESITTDGFKFLLGNGEWVAFRASGTEPVFRCYIEARSEAQFRKLENACKKLLTLG